MTREQLERSRETWRAMAMREGAARQALVAKGDQWEIVEDEAGDLFMVLYGVHGYPISIELLAGPTPENVEAFRKHADRIVGDVRMMKRAGPKRPWWRFWERV